VTLRSKITDDGMLLVEVEDDGVGMAPERNVASPVSGLVQSGTGIGMRNVRDRMKVLYGEMASLEINSRPGRGTKVALRMPILDAEAETWGQSERQLLEAATNVVEDVVRRLSRS
jgi:two-component system LytT family sensor kinase